SSGRSRATGVASVAAAVLLAAISSPVAATEPGRIGTGGDDPAIVVAQSAEDLAVTRWKLDQAERLRVAVGRGARAEGAGQGARPQPALVPPVCTYDCAPVTFALASWARQQINWYYCGPASAQVIINQTREIASASTGGQSTTANYRTQSAIGSFMGTNDQTGTSSGQLRNGLNQFADLDDTGRHIAFTILDGIASGSDFHWAMVTATWLLQRGAAVPVQMTYSSQHLASWASSSWWSRNPSAVVRHWISVHGYSGFWDGSYTPTLAYTDSAGGYGGQTGNFVSSSRLVYNLNQANSGRIVY
ncbi:MAG TPA: hypothetical protein VET90_06355, partial [Candidatus Binatus sp.]|nr:hypothetical protein [Candidatus Binatus sp.]